jgi:hypothetical protein
MEVHSSNIARALHIAIEQAKREAAVARVSLNAQVLGWIETLAALRRGEEVLVKSSSNNL